MIPFHPQNGFADIGEFQHLRLAKFFSRLPKCLSYESSAYHKHYS